MGDKFVLQVQKADGKLDMIAWQIDAFEKAFEDPEDEVNFILFSSDCEYKITLVDRFFSCIFF